MRIEPGARPQPSPLQRQWLTELGVDRHFLDHLCRDDTFIDAAPEPAAARSPASAQQAPSKGRGAASPGGEPVLASPSAGVAAAAVPRPVARPAGNKSVSADEAAAGMPVQPAADLAGLQQQVGVCQACGLHQARAIAVFGAGHSREPEWMLVGEAPTTDDDRQGLPGQGRAGALLEAMLRSAGVNPHTQVYQTHLVKCRPLGNRTPTPEEIQCCSAYLRRQIALINPGRLVAMGRLAAQALSGHTSALDDLRGKTFDYRCESGRTVPLVVTHNPTALLSRPQHKLQVWRDILYMRQS